MMKKILMSLGIFFGLILAGIIIIPLVVNVDSYRPQLVELVNQKINGRFELAKLKLSLWGQVRVDVEGLALKDQKGHSLLEVKEAYIHLPLMPLISGDPLLTFKMVKPELSARKAKDGKINWLSLMKPEAKEASKPADAAVAAADAPKKEGGAKTAVELPAIALRARLGFEITESILRYLDETTGFQTQVDDLHVALRDISLSRPMQLEITAGLNSSQGKTLKVSGKMSTRGQAQALVEANQVKGVQASMVADFTPMQVEMPGLFLKKAGVAARADIKMQASPEQVQIDKFTLEFFNAKIDVFAKMVLGPKAEGAAQAPVDVNFNVKSNEIDLAPWAEVLPPLQGYALGGKMKFQAQGHGKSDQLQYAADLTVQDMTAKAPHLKAAPVIQAQVVVSTDRIEKMVMDLKGPGNDLRVSGQLVSFTKPAVTLKVESTGMDLDQWIDFPKPAPQAADGKSAAKGDAAKSAETDKKAAAAPEVDLDATLDPLRKNEMAKAMSLMADINMKFIQAQKVRVSDISGRMTLKNLDFAIDKFAFGIFGGRITNDFQLSMLPKTPTYKFGLQVSSLDLKQAVESSLGLMKNTLFGKLSTQVKGSGSSFNAKTAKTKLDAQGNFKVESATFATVDVMKMTTDGLNQAMTKVGEKVPALKGKTIGAPKNAETRYEFVSSDFKISQGRFVAPNFHAKAEPGKGIDIKGNTEMGLVDQSLKAQWQVIDSQNMTKARDISVEQAGTKVEHVLAEGNNPITFPVTVGCTVMAPCYSYTEVPQHFATIAFNNVAGAATARLKSEATKKVEEKLKQIVPKDVQEKIPPKVNDQVKDLKKKFGF